MSDIFQKGDPNNSTLSYYNLEAFKNVQYALNITLKNYYANLLFGGDLNRVIYSSTQFAFRKRARDSEINLNTLDFPFMNFRVNKITGIQSGDLNRKLWQHIANIEGMYFDDLGKKLRYTPVQFEYDATYFCSRNDELQYAHSLLTWQYSNESIVVPTITVNQQDIPFSAYVSENLDYEPEYNETSALEKNSIHSLSLNPNVITVLIRENLPGTTYSLNKKIMFDFIVGHGEIADENNITENYQFIVNHFDETVTPLI